MIKHLGWIALLVLVIIITVAPFAYFYDWTIDDDCRDKTRDAVCFEPETLVVLMATLVLTALLFGITTWADLHVPPSEVYRWWIG